MLSVKECRKLVRSEISISDEELERMQLLLRQVAEDVFSSFEGGRDESGHLHKS